MFNFAIIFFLFPKIFKIKKNSINKMFISNFYFEQSTILVSLIKNITIIEKPIKVIKKIEKLIFRLINIFIF